MKRRSRAAELREFREAAPDDPMPMIGQARLAIRRTRMREAKQLLKEALAEAPDQIEAQAELGHLLWTEADPEFNQWLVEAAPGTEDHPDIWLTRGLWAKQQGQTRGAARCFWEAIRLDPGQQAAAYHLGQVLQVLDDPQSARRLSDRAARLQRLSGVMGLLYLDRSNLALHHEAAPLTESLGRIWETYAWRQAILQIDPQDAESRQTLDNLSPLLREKPPQVLDSHNPAKQIDLSNFALPRWDADLPASKTAPEPEQFRAHFADVAARAGIDFRYFAGLPQRLAIAQDLEHERCFRFAGQIVESYTPLKLFVGAIQPIIPQSLWPLSSPPVSFRCRSRNSCRPGRPNSGLR